ncbi:Alpha-agarase [Zhongshania aliphaticivorans]|uniref:Alpha-agarase n=1 Tax=Zhongshania aliphaticivorans TaxID=1470434 RepID=A0A5S9PX24_9GAMM|nr:thrombospondin type 3 repeat-containing protein [Zhongshania aliphaticivorans]CAA0109626.1 Alpha-agarase [Zhongshania aliphaticivorans]CAA0117784.1 Alpha-agarase [Zhongshania aliphaticivorans]CAA0121529.1 Alpha-agarase [Zhongshania aliphaticivorans]
MYFRRYIYALMAITILSACGGNSVSGTGVSDSPDNGGGSQVLDADADGIPDSVDNCPNNSNPGQANIDSDAFGDACDTDADNDGVSNSSDNCPSIANSNQADQDGDLIGDACDAEDNSGGSGGSTDADEDGIFDADDNCPTTSNPGQEDTDSDGVGDTCDDDADNDGVVNGGDNCPVVANENQQDTDSDGVGDVCDSQDDRDSDSDGVLDTIDNCPLLANPGQGDLDGDSVGDACDPEDNRDSDDDGIGNEDDLCADSAADASVDTSGCAASQVNASCGDSFASVTAGRHYQVELTSASGENISFEVFEPLEIACGGRASGAHPLVLHGHGLGGARVSDTGGEYTSNALDRLVAGGYPVISIDLRGFGDSSGTVRVMDPEVEGLDLLQILDWAESNLDYLAWRDESSGEFISRPDVPVSVAGGANLLVGSVGSSYGGGYQMLIHGVDEKQRLDAMVPDITWHNLPYSLNQGDVVKSAWALLLVAGAEAGSYAPGFENQDSPLARGLDPFVVETLARGIATNEFPRDAIDWFAYHSPRYWCGLNGQAAMPYSVAASELNNNITSEFNEAPGSNTYTGQPGVDVLLTQGIRDTLFNFNDAWWNFQCLRDRTEDTGHEVRMLTHETGHIIPGFIGETPEPVYFQAPAGKFACGEIDQRDATIAWFDEKLRGLPAADYFDGNNAICMSLADDDAVMIPVDEFKARRADQDSDSAVAFSEYTDLSAGNVLNGVEAQAAHLLGQDVAIIPLLSVADSKGLIVAGIPQLDITVTTPQMVNDALCALGSIPTLRIGCDSILFTGVAVRHAGGEWQLLDDQIAPVRGLGEHIDIDMVGVAERLDQGDELGLWVSGYHAQYLEAFSRDATIAAVNIAASIRLPLFAVGADGQPDFEADVSESLALPSTESSPALPDFGNELELPTPSL